VKDKVKVTFQPTGRTVYVLRGTILLEAAARAGSVIETPCAGAGKCGKCLVRITAGSCTEPVDAAPLTPRQIADGYRLACRCCVSDDLVVEVPETSLFQAGQKILEHDSGERVELRPSVTKRHVRLSAPDRDNVCSDVERLTESLGTVDVDVAVLRNLPAVLRSGAPDITATIVGNRVVQVESGNHTDTCFGMAFDVGTTTIVGTLVDLTTGHDLAVASMINPQTSFGDDVVSRIKKCREQEDGLDELRGAVMKAIDTVTGDAAAQAGVSRRDICEAVFAGNTTMQQIVCGINPSSLGELPFVPAFRQPLVLRAEELGLDINPAAGVLVFPQIGGFVGGDTVAGILATGMRETGEPTLLVDVGTNGEIVLAHDGRLVATSVAAGPAFEGARIVNGMRATNGAIEKVLFDGDVRINVIGNVPPTGICGTGLIDAAAAMLRSGVLDVTGRIVDPDEQPDDVPDLIRQRVRTDDGQNAFVLAEAAESGIAEGVCLYQRDIRELQLANGAIRAGISILLRMEGIDASDLAWVLLAGAFGNFIRRSNARRIGMLPAVPTDRIRFVGNTASFGAKRALLSEDEKEYAAKIIDEVQHVDLSLNPGFQVEFGNAMLFPGEE